MDTFDISGTYVDIYPCLVETITISNVDKLKIMATVSSVHKNHAIGRQHS